MLGSLGERLDAMPIEVTVLLNILFLYIGRTAVIVIVGTHSSSRIRLRLILYPLLVEVLLDQFINQ